MGDGSCVRLCSHASLSSCFSSWVSRPSSGNAGAFSFRPQIAYTKQLEHDHSGWASTLAGGSCTMVAALKGFRCGAMSMRAPSNSHTSVSPRRSEKSFAHVKSAMKPPRRIASRSGSQERMSGQRPEPIPVLNPTINVSSRQIEGSEASSAPKVPRKRLATTPGPNLASFRCRFSSISGPTKKSSKGKPSMRGGKK